MIAYRTASTPVTQPPITADPRQIYHSLIPLPALSPVPRPADPASVAEQAANEAVYRQLLCHGILAILLPTEDLENGCLTALVGEILSELIVGNVVANKLCEPWFILELVCIASGVVTGRRGKANGGHPGSESSKAPSVGPRAFSVQAIFWTVMQWVFVAVSALRIAFAVLAASSSLPSRVPSVGDDGPHHTQRIGPKNQQQQRARPVPASSAASAKTPVLAFRTWSAISNLLEMKARMPWLCGALSMAQWVTIARPGRMGGVDGWIDR